MGDESHALNIYGAQYGVVVTSNPHVLARWIFDLLVDKGFLHRNGFNALINQGTFVLNNSILRRILYVGFDTLCNHNDPNQNPATIQFCRPGSCIIFQLRHAPEIPNFLIHFLRLPFVRFVGFRVVTKASYLYVNHNLGIPVVFDFCRWAFARYRLDEDNRMYNDEVETMSFEDLVFRVFGTNYQDKPRDIVESNWEAQELTPEQVKCVACDCFWISALIDSFTNTTWWMVFPSELAA